MISLSLVIFAFALMFLSDGLKLHRKTSAGKLFFAAGMLVLVAAGIFAALKGQHFYLAPAVSILFLLISAAGAWGVCASLFFSLPADSTYLVDQQESVQLVDSGLYALCRHPGALWFPVFSCFLALGLGNIDLLASAALASLLNILYVWYQDYKIFPVTIKGYEQYQKITPFLLPTAHSLSRAIGEKTKKQGN